MIVEEVVVIYIISCIFAWMYFDYNYMSYPWYYPLIWPWYLFVVIVNKFSNYNTYKSTPNTSYGKSKWENIGYATYDEVLQDNRWQTKRLQILQRDNNCCVWCGSPYNLQVHHKYYIKYRNGYKKAPWDYPNKALMTLCDCCHQKYHQKYVVKTFYKNI